MSDLQNISSAIMFFYYKDIELAAQFYSNVMGFKLVDYQKWAKIYKINGNAFMGVVGEGKGFCKVQDENAVLLTLVVDNVYSWYEHLKERGITPVTEIQEKEDIQVRCFFLKDPGGYALEIQQFLNPKVAEIFRMRE